MAQIIFTDSQNMITSYSLFGGNRKKGVTLDLYHKCSKKQFIWNFRIQDPNYVKRMKNFSRYKHVEKEFMLEYSTPLHQQSRI